MLSKTKKAGYNNLLCHRVFVCAFFVMKDGAFNVRETSKQEISGKKTDFAFLQALF